MGVDFKVIQAQFAAYIRDPENMPVPTGVDPKRMAMYRELFFNNINSILSSNFPVLRKLYSDQDWLALVQDFYLKHRCHTPHFAEIAAEFLDYLQNERDEGGDFPFLLELAHYEWVEMALYIAQDQPEFGDRGFADDILKRPMKLSPLAWPLVYQYPVERIGPDFIPERPPAQPTFLVVYRDKDDEVRFLQTTPLTYQLLQCVEQQPGTSGAACLQALVNELVGQIEIDPETLRSFGLKTLQELAVKGVIIPAASV